MEVKCGNCGTEYEFDEALVSARGTTVKCTQCDHQFRVYPEPDAAEPELWLISCVDGRKLECKSIRELQQVIGKGLVTALDSFSRDGEKYRLLSTVPELSTFFSAFSASAKEAAPKSVARPAGGVGLPKVPAQVASPNVKETASSSAVGTTNDRSNPVSPSALSGEPVDEASSRPSTKRLAALESTLVSEPPGTETSADNTLDNIEVLQGGGVPALDEPLSDAPSFNATLTSVTSDSQSEVGAPKAPGTTRGLAPPQRSVGGSVAEAAVTAKATPVVKAPLPIRQLTADAEKREEKASTTTAEDSSFIAAESVPPDSAEEAVHSEPGAAVSAQELDVAVASEIAASKIAAADTVAEVEASAADSVSKVGAVDAAPVEERISEVAPSSSSNTERSSIVDSSTVSHQRRTNKPAPRGRGIFLTVLLGFGAIGAVYFARQKLQNRAAEPAPLVESSMDERSLESLKEALLRDEPLTVEKLLLANSKLKTTSEGKAIARRLELLSLDAALLRRDLGGVDASKTIEGLQSSLGELAKDQAQLSLSFKDAWEQVLLLRVLGQIKEARELASNQDSTESSSVRAYALASLELAEQLALGEESTSYDSVLSQLRSAIRQNPQFLRARALLIGSLRRDGKLQLAREELTQFPQDEMKLRPALEAFLANGEEEASSTDSTEEPLEPIAPSNVEDEQLRTLLAAARDAKAESKWGDAKSLFKQILKISPKNEEALGSLGQIAKMENDFETAKRYLEAALVRDPSYAPAVLSLGDLYWERGDQVQAVRYYRRLPASSSQSARVQERIVSVEAPRPEPVVAPKATTPEEKIEPKTTIERETPYTPSETSSPPPTAPATPAAPEPKTSEPVPAIPPSESQ